MLLKQLIESPMTSSKLLVCDPFREYDQEELVQEVIGLANADVDGPRNILFGINSGALDGGGIVGISESAMADLKKAHRMISALIEPVLHLAFIYDMINGKLVGTLEIDGCDDGPYIVAKSQSERLTQGQCWIREGRELSVVRPDELSQNDGSEADKKPAKMGKPPPISVGFNEEPDCELLEMDIPDASDPPFPEQVQEARQPSDLKKTIREKIGTVTTRILRIGGLQENNPATKPDESASDTEIRELEGTATVLAEANDHYFFEEKALRLNLCVCNRGSEPVENVSITLGFPRLPGFDVVDRIHTSPFDKRAQNEARKAGYPNIERRDDAIMVRGSIDRLSPGDPTQAFRCELRMAVAPRMKRKKIAILYTLQGEGKQTLAKGRLKIKFGQVSA